jgi:hypothetical protein
MCEWRAIEGNFRELASMTNMTVHCLFLAGPKCEVSSSSASRHLLSSPVGIHVEAAAERKRETPMPSG